MIWIGFAILGAWNLSLGLRVADCGLHLDGVEVNI